MLHLPIGCKRLVLAGLLTGALWACASTPASADEVDVAVDAFAVAGASVGVTLDPTEKTITKAIIRCVGTKNNLADCARGEVVHLLPADAQPVVLCVLQGKPIDACAQQAMLQRLPPETRTIALCLGQRHPLSQCATGEAARHLPPEVQPIGACIAAGRTFEACAGDEATRRLPAQTRDLAPCLARADLGQCAGHAAAGTAHRQALALIDKLKADGRTDLGARPGTPISRIVVVAQAIREDDWPTVVAYGGAEVYKVAAKAVLNVLLTPAFQPLIGPIVDAVVEHRVDLFTRLVKALRKKDERAVGEIAVEAYLTFQVEVACALPMPDDMREALCGTIGQIIKHVAKVGGDVADLAKRLIERPLAIPATLWDETQGLREKAAGKSVGCTPPPTYYAKDYVGCYHHATYLKLSQPSHLQKLTDSLNNDCRHYYDQCYFSNRFDGLCNPQRDMFLRHVNQLAGGLHEAAVIYAKSLRPVFAAAGKQICNGAFATEKLKEFTANCARDLHKQVPLKGGGNSCQGGQFSPQQTAHWLACNNAVADLHPQQLVDELCRTPEPNRPLRLMGREHPVPRQ